MACNSLSIGRALPCTSSVGGIKAIYVAPFNSLGALTIVSGQVTAIGNDGSVDLYKYDLESSNGLEQAVTASAENGSVYYEQTLTMTLKKLDLLSQQELIDLIKSRTQIFVEDYNGNAYLVGREHGADVTGGTVASGAAMGDMSGYTLSFSAMEKTVANFITGATDGNPFAGMAAASATIVVS